jgi:hypothetical protein
VDGRFAQESAGRELAEHFLTDAFNQLKAAAVSPDFNSDLVYDGMGYLRHPVVFGHLVEHLKSILIGDRTYPATIRAIGVHDSKLSLGVLAGELVQGRLQGELPEGAAGALFDALGHVRDPRALEVLKDLKAWAKHHARVPYLRARARHGDGWAITELIVALTDPAKAAFLDDARYRREEVVAALLWVDTPEATAALKRYVQETWPTRILGPALSHELQSSSLAMQNYAGTSRRSTAIGEVARRDPRWLAELAFQQMAAPTLLARTYGASVFRELTGRSFDYRPEAFASERALSLKKVAAWWAEHKGESREQWLLSYFREKGFPMTHLQHRESLPVLVRALEADFFTHNLAVEQISALTGRYFTSFATEDRSWRGQEQMTRRVVGWLRARQLLPRG